jgi:predicted transcriptional regulator
MAMLAAGHQQTEVADKLGITPSAVCQRLSRARREWEKFQGEGDPNRSSRPLKASA